MSGCRRVPSSVGPDPEPFRAPFLPFGAHHDQESGPSSADVAAASEFRMVPMAPVNNGSAPASPFRGRHVRQRHSYRLQRNGLLMTHQHHHHHHHHHSLGHGHGHGHGQQQSPGTTARGARGRQMVKYMPQRMMAMHDGWQATTDDVEDSSSSSNEASHNNTSSSSGNNNNGHIFGLGAEAASTFGLNSPFFGTSSFSSGNRWGQRIGDMLLSEDEEMTDVTFIVQCEEDEGGYDSGSVSESSGNRIRYRAHRLILALRSPVFRAMFYGPLAEKTEEITVPDVTPSAFKAMLHYIYKDEVLLLQSLQGAWQLWYAAKKYMLDGLEEKCRKHLKTNLTPLNVLDTYIYADNYGDAQVIYQCLRLIDKNARYIFASPSFLNLPISLVKSLVSRNTLAVREVEVFDAVIRWIQAELKRRVEDAEDTKVPSMEQLYKEFEGVIRYPLMSSKELVHHVLPYNVLDLETLSKVCLRIRHREEPQEFTDTTLTYSGMGSVSEPKLGLNQARDLLLFEAAVASKMSPEFKCLEDHVSKARSHASNTHQEPRFGPGYYQCARFSSVHHLLIAKNWPSEYSLKFRCDRAIYMLGACITETDRQFYSPRMKYSLKLKDATDKILAQGSEAFMKKISHKIEGGFPKQLIKGPHDITFKGPAHLLPDQWYKLELSMDGTASTSLGHLQCPLLLTRCFPEANAFGAKFEFQEPKTLSGCSTGTSEVSDDDAPEDVKEATDEDNVFEDSEQESGDFSPDVERDTSLPFGLISRIYFYY